MTDITALAQREKFEAWLEGAEALPWGYLKKRRTSDEAYHEPNTTDMWGAWQAASAELVEALEKAQKLATQQGNIACALFDEVTAQRQRIAELESRTVTVKLPERYDVETYPLQSPKGEWYSRDDVLATLAAAGIQVIEGEGQ